MELQFGHEWRTAKLPFSPAAINNAGLIVGEQNGHAVQYVNGAAQVLPLPDGTGVTYGAIDVTVLGAILGQTNRLETPAVLWWPPPLPLPPAPVGVFVPAAINRNLTIVGSSLDAQAAFKWTPTEYSGLVAPGGSSQPTFATDINDGGLIVGYTLKSSLATAVLWNPANIPKLLFGIHSVPHINNAGAVFALDSGRNVTVAHLDGTIDTFPAIPDPLSADAISDEGRLIGTSIVGGVKKGWTFYKHSLTWLDPPPGDQGDYVHPTGVNRCGNIVGRVLRQNGTFVEGVLFSKAVPVFQCDGDPIVHP